MEPWVQFDMPESSENCSWGSGSSSSLAYSQNINHLDNDPAYSGVRPAGIVHNYDNSLGPQGSESSDNESWLYSQDANFRQDSYYEDENPADYGVRPSGKYQSSNIDTFRIDWTIIAHTERCMGFEEDGVWRVCQNPKRSQFAVQFPVEVFERDPKIFPWSGYIFDIASFGYWIYRCAGEIKTLCNLYVALETNNCLWYLGLNEQEANSLLGKIDGDSEEKVLVGLWLEECSEFMALLNERVHLCYDRRPPDETEIYPGSCYPGFCIAKFLFEDVTWMQEYIRAVRRFNQKFASEFG